MVISYRLYVRCGFVDLVNGKHLKLLIHYCIPKFCYVGKLAYILMPKFLVGCHYNEDKFSWQLKTIQDIGLYKFIITSLQLVKTWKKWSKLKRGGSQLVGLKNLTNPTLCPWCFRHFLWRGAQHLPPQNRINILIYETCYRHTNFQVAMF